MASELAEITWCLFCHRDRTALRLKTIFSTYCRKIWTRYGFSVWCAAAEIHETYYISTAALKVGVQRSACTYTRSNGANQNGCQGKGNNHHLGRHFEADYLEVVSGEGSLLIQDFCSYTGSEKS
ncbi:hypothetical protein BGZ94_005910 [Podila epigama]|nr:hypothetical protein BGZ94_005910 [Podila epigama]